MISSAVQDTGKRQLISVVLPVFNEKKNITPIAEKIMSIFHDHISYDFEIIFVDDGSSDDSQEELVALGKKYHNVKSLRFSRNFGHQIALTAGLDHAKGDAVICMDSDFQHPPELIPSLIAKWESGYDTVYTIRKDNENTSRLNRITGTFFYWFINKISHTPINRNAADYRLMNRRALNEFLKLRERDRFIRGMVNWVGFKMTTVEFDLEKRIHGKSKYSLGKQIFFALNGITSFSGAPLRLPFVMGLVIVAGSFIYALYLTIKTLFFHAQYPDGWLTIFVSVLFFGGLQLVFIGVLGEYVYRIYNETKQRPLYIIDTSINF